MGWRVLLLATGCRSSILRFMLAMTSMPTVFAEYFISQTVSTLSARSNTRSICTPEVPRRGGEK